MFRINKSILMVCLISIFLLASQASAADSNLNRNDINSIDEGIRINDQSIDSNNNIKNSPNSLMKENISISEKSSIIKNQSTQKLKNNDLDNNDLKIDNLNDDDLNIDNSEIKDTKDVVMANDNFSCGPASLATALNRLGMNLSLNEVSSHTNTSEENGTNMQSLIDAAKYYNFSAIGVKIDSSDLKENSLVHLNLDGGDHWTVVTKVTANLVFLADSTEGNINMSIDKFNSLFSGNAIIISKINETGLNEEISNKNISILDSKQCQKISGKGWKRVIVGYKTVWKWGFITKYSWVLRPKVVKGHVSFSQWEYVYVGHPVWGKYKVRVPIYKYKYLNVHI